MKLTADIGGSKTRVKLYDNEQVKEYEILGGFGRAKDSEEILSLLAQNLNEIFIDVKEKVNYVCVNLGGKNLEQIKRTFLSLFINAKINAFRESEGIAALKMMQIFNANVIVMAGTGCIVLAKNGDKNCVIGGWGKDISDVGSGYNIGLSAIKTALYELDGVKELSALTKKITGIEKPFNFSNVKDYCAIRDNVRAKLPKSREDIAKLTKIVVDLAKAGCPISKNIIADNVNGMIKQIKMAMDKVGIKNATVVINGGISNFSDLYIDQIKNELKEQLIDIKCINNGIDLALKNICEEN